MRGLAIVLVLLSGLGSTNAAVWAQTECKVAAKHCKPA